MSAADPNVTSASTSSNSSTSLSPSDPFRNLRAALERHKPLGTTQSTSNMPRARRILVSRPQTTKSTLAKSSISARNQNINAGTRKTASASVPVNVPVDNNNTNNNNENELNYMVSVAPLDTFPTQNTDTKMENYATQNTDTKMENNPTQNTDTKMENYPTQNTEPKLVNYPTQNTETKLENYPTQNTETKLEHKVSTHMHSLALTEEANPTKMLQNLSTIFQGSNSNTIPQKGFEETTRLNPAITYPITHSNQINPNPITQCSVLNSSCITKQSTLEPRLANYENAPAEKKVSFEPESAREDKTEKKEKKEKEKEKDKSRKKGYDSEMFFKVNGKYYQKLGKIGSGGSSEVHKVISAEKNIFALKKIKLRGRDYPTALGFCQEIEYLNKLKGKTNIIQLIDYEITDKTLLLEGSSTAKEGRIKEDNCIYMVLEYGEIDLAHMVSQKWREANDSSALRINENWLRFYWQQILEAVNTIHEERIVHSDLKPANFLLVRGSLKLIDFGIAKAIMNDTTNIQRDAQAGTLNYMSPEAFLCNEEDSTGAPIKCGRPSDIWSLGCILYQMVYGKTPFADYTTFWAKFKVVTNRNHEISYQPVPNPWLIDLMRRCLAWDRNDRWRISELLKHPFLMPPALPMEGPVRRLMERIGSYWDRAEVKRLCGELGEVITRIEKEEEE